MNKRIAFKTMSLGLCAAMCLSMGACGYIKPDDTRPYEEEETSEAVTTDEETASTAPETTEAPETSSSETVPEINPYEKFINGYKEALENPTDTWYYGPDTDPRNYTNSGQGLIVADMHDSFSYTLYDIDKDGTPELIIGFEDTSENDVARIWITGVVAMDGDKYKIVAAGWDRSSLEYTGNGYFVNDGSGGAFLHYNIVYRYDGEQKALVSVGALVTEYSYEDDYQNPQYSYFLSDWDAFVEYPAYGSSKAVCFDDEAYERFTADIELAYSQDNDLIGREWTRVEF